MKLSDYARVLKKFMGDSGYDLINNTSHTYYFDFIFGKNGNPIEVLIQFEAQFDAYTEEEEDGADYIDIEFSSSSGVSAILDSVYDNGLKTKREILYKEIDDISVSEKDFLKIIDGKLKEIEKHHKEILLPKLVKDMIVAIHIDGAEKWQKEYYWFINNSDNTWTMVEEAGLEEEFIDAVTKFEIDDLLPESLKELFLF